MQRARLRPGAVEEEERLRLLRRREVGRAIRGVDQRGPLRQGLERRGRATEPIVHPRAHALEAELGEARGSERMLALLWVLQNDDLGSVADEGDVAADADGRRLSATVTMLPHVPMLAPR